MTAENVASIIEQRLQAGWQQCSRCHAVSKPERDTCFQCQQPLTTASLVPPTGGAGPARKRPKTAATNTSANRGKRALGGLADLPGHTLDVVAYGLPETQGSGVAVAKGVWKADHSKELHRWRNAITAATKTVCGTAWVAPNCPLTLLTVFTVPAPAAAKPGSYADTYRDLDKLLRAVGDALTPTKGFRAVASDMRYVTHLTAKTFPAELATHPLALDQPGVVIRVCPALTPTLDTDGTYRLVFPTPFQTPCK